MINNYRHIKSRENDVFRHSFIATLIEKYSSAETQVLFDIGAGLSPFKKVSLDCGWAYKSHDFGKYLPSDERYPGLQNESWAYPDHDYWCDILDLPMQNFSDLILCTEVFEHIPNPIAALEKMTRISKPNGLILVTVPFSSIMHQAPYWFQSGLSPYWFNHWADKFNIEILDMLVYGDYLDVLMQEIFRIFPFPLKRKLFRFLSPVLRRFIHKEILESSGFGVIFLGKVLKK